ncbi:hypothetical protein M404DRAFT_814923 [Pisolithus tinctorius Marx 270]|uniref:Uncharacterized protein n=1 Tax=Pisolithus tinctorius Marx 270 TaxID=870435 RepID=A0A0C3NEE1_PISTI|nr:hypothetical protein M404DRAFT_814923 [Pisolithus tinctorius Marx 270]
MVEKVSGVFVIGFEVRPCFAGKKYVMPIRSAELLTAAQQEGFFVYSGFQTIVSYFEVEKKSPYSTLQGLFYRVEVRHEICQSISTG